MTPIRALTCALLALPLAACDLWTAGSDGSHADDPSSLNRAPVISGQPPAVAYVNRPFYFRPSAYDPDGDVLVFKAQQLPAWARLNMATGEVTGTPPLAAAGTRVKVSIAVTDGEMKTLLPAFTVAITDAPAPTPTPTVSVTLNWTAPAQNEDGSSLTNLAGYRVYYGKRPDDLGQRVDVNDPGANGTTVTGLSSGTWYFAVSSVNTSGIESRRSGPVSLVK